MDYTSLIKEVDIPELVKALRFCARWHRADDALANAEQAAAAIEALQAEQKKTVTQIFGEEQMAWEGRCKDLMYQIADLQAQLPKRGEWVRVEGEESYHYECSRCGERPLYSRYGDVVLSGVCPMCGAKMEVQE